MLYLGAIVLITWLGGLALEGSEQKKWLLSLILVLEFGGIIYVKLDTSMVAPLGLSYFTFQSAGLLIDIYRGKVQAQKNPLKVWMFAGYFLQLAQGPISSWKELGNQLFTGHYLNPVTFVSGFQLMLWGYFKKMVLADRLAATTNVLLEDPTLLPGWLVLGCVILYAVRLYGDFSGGMDVVRGISRMLGIELPQNFRRPFFSLSVAEYWRRWHITLGGWFRSYLLYPLTTSRVGIWLGRKASKLFGKKTGRVLPTALATFLVFLFIGVWHTFSWNAVIYGGYFGLLMAVSILLDPLWKKLNRRWKLKEKRWMTPWRMIRTWILILPAQFFAFTASTSQSAALIKQSFANWSIGDAVLQLTGIMSWLEWGIAGIALLVMLLVDILCERGIDLCERLARASISLAGPPLSESSNGKPVLTGLFEVGEDVEYFTTHTIENCTVNDKPLFYACSLEQVTVPEDAGEVICCDCEEVIVQNVDVSDSSMGMVLAYNDHVTIENCRADRCGVFGIYVAKCESGILRNCVSEETNHGLDIRACRNFALIDCSAVNCDQGLFFSCVEDSLMTGCSVTGTGQGYFMAGGNRNAIYDCTAIDCENGFNLQKEGDVLMANCSIRDCTVCGVRLDWTPTVFSGNYLSGNWVGVMAYGDAAFDLTDNVFENSLCCGLYLKEIAYSRFCGNTFTGDTGDSVQVEGAAGGSLWNGNILDKTIKTTEETDFNIVL